tara:strand:- start:2189 stop:2377 length:189 start_codon:yes stop_codon:yes gene_type:complete
MPKSSDLMEQIKSLIPIFALVAAIAGFYYTTNHRLDHLESSMESLREENKKIKKLINKGKKK